MNMQEQIDMLIDRLEKAENEIKEIKMIRLNIVREFAERLKKELNNTPNGWAYTTFIDKLLKEYE